MENDSLRNYQRVVMEAASRIQSGAGNEEDEAIVREGMLRFPPSSSVYRLLSNALSKNAPAGFSTFPDADRRTLAERASDATSGWPGFQWSGPDPTASFLNTPSGAVVRGKPGSGLTDDLATPLPNEPSPAAEADMRGQPTETTPNQMGMNPGTAPDYNWAADMGPAAGGLMSDPFAGLPMLQGPGEDYLVSGIPLNMRTMVAQNPQVLMNMMGMGGMERGFMAPFMQSAQALSGMGILGRGLPGDQTLMSGPSSSTGTLANLEDFAAMMGQEGSQFIDPDMLVQEAMARADATNLDQQTDPRTGQPLGVEDQIDLTISAVMASAPYMTPETQALMSSRLDQARLDYMTGIATGDLSGVTFPKYLQLIGINDWLG